MHKMAAGDAELLELMEFFNVGDWDSSYDADTIRIWRAKEAERCQLALCLPQWKVRNTMLEFMMQATRALDIDRENLHLAVYFLDYFIEHYFIFDESRDLITFTCLGIAVEVNGPSSSLPSLKAFNDWNQSKFQKRDFLKCEIMIMKTFDFKLWYPTVSTFAHFFIKLMLEQNIELDMLLHNEKTILNMVDLTLKYREFHNSPPSLVAAASFAAVRLLLGMDMWSVGLQTIMGYSKSEVCDYAYTMIILYETLNCQHLHHHHKHPHEAMNTSPI